MTAAVTAFLLALPLQQPVPLHVYVTSSTGGEKVELNTKDASRWNTQKIDGVEIHLAKELDQLAAPPAKRMLAESVKGFEGGVLIGEGISDSNAVNSLREALLRSPFSLGLAGQVGRARNPRAFVGPATRVQVEVSGRTFDLKTVPTGDDPRLAMTDADLSPHPRAKEFESAWSRPSPDAVHCKLEFHLSGPFYGDQAFRATILAARQLEERMAEVRKEFERTLRGDIESTFGKTGWSDRPAFLDELPASLAKQLEADARARYQELGFRTADEAAASLRNAKLNVKTLDLMVVVRRGSAVQAFGIGTY